MYKKFGKRLIDLVLSACGILFLSPILLILVIAIKLDSPGPVLFKQKRVGLHKKHFNILIGQMSIIGPRPALWNQYDLIEERDKYGANDVVPGLTGWAQINGRDELEIPVKAKLDGEYVENMSFLFDCKCFFKTFTSVLKHEGVVEGGTGTLQKEEDTK